MSLRTVRRGWRRVAAGTLAGVAFLLIAAGVWGYRARQPKVARAAVSEARQFLAQGKPGRALEAVAGVSASGPCEAELLTVRGLAYAAFDRPEAARPLLERSLKLNPAQPMAAKVLAAVFFTANQPERGLALLAQAAKLEPDDFRPWYAAGKVLLRQPNQAEKTVAVFKEALKRRPDHFESRMGLAEALVALGRTDEAAPLVGRLLGERADDPAVLKIAARLAKLQGDLDRMNRYASEALALDPDDGEANGMRAQYLLGAGQAAEALKHAERAVGREPNDMAALNVLARAEKALGLEARSAATSARLRQAKARAERLDQLRTAVRDRPDDPTPLWQLGKEAAEGGLSTLAANSFRAALALDPKCLPARDGLAALGQPARGGSPGATASRRADR